MRRTAVVLWASLLVVTCLRVEAQPSDKKRAEALFNEARTLMDRSDFTAACPKLEQSWNLDAAVGTAFNLALCFEKAGRLASALAWYEKARDAASAANQQKRVDFARAQITALGPRVPRLTVNVAAPVPGMTLTRGGVPITAGAPMPLDPGGYVIESTAPDHQPFRQEVTLTEGQQATVDVALAKVVVEKPEVPEPPPTDGRRKTRLILGWSVTGVGVAATTVGLIVGLSAKSSWDDARELCPEGSPVCSDEAVELGDKAKSKALVSTIVTAVGLVGIGTGIVLLVTAPKNPERSAQLVPLVGEGVYGLAVTGGF